MSGFTSLNDELQVVTPQLLEELQLQAKQRLARTHRRMTPAQAAAHFGRRVVCWVGCGWSGRVRLAQGTRLRDYGCPECSGRLRILHPDGCRCSNCRRGVTPPQLREGPRA